MIAPMATRRNTTKNKVPLHPPVPPAPKTEAEELFEIVEKFWRKEMSAISDKIAELGTKVDALIAAVDKALPNVATQADLDAITAIETKVDAETAKASQ